MKVKKYCKFCGKEYDGCLTPPKGAVRWQDVACCVDHAIKYFNGIEKVKVSDSKDKSSDSIETTAAPAIEIVDEDIEIDDIIDDEDEDYEEDEDDFDLDEEE